MRDELDALIAQARAVPDDVRLPVVADVIACVVDNAREGGSFRHLIYDRLGFGSEAYYPLYIAGGQAITNHFSLNDQAAEGGLPGPIRKLEAMAHAAPMVPHPTLTNVAGEPLRWPSEERTSLFHALYTAAELVNMNSQLQETNHALAARCEKFERTLAPKGEQYADEHERAAQVGANDSALAFAVSQALTLMALANSDRPEHLEAMALLRSALAPRSGVEAPPRDDIADRSHAGPL